MKEKISLFISSFLLSVLFITSFIFPLSVSADVLSVLEKEALYYNINHHVMKENELYNYTRQYLINTLDNTPTRTEINSEFNLQNSMWTNYVNENCSENVGGVCSEIGGILLTILPASVTLNNALAQNTTGLSQSILDIYNNNSYETLNSYVLTNIHRVYDNDDTFKHLLLLRNHIYINHYDGYIFKTETEANAKISDKMWFKPNNINGLETYIYDVDTSKWKLIGTLGWNENTPYELNFFEETIFNPDTFPGVLNMSANITKGNNLMTFYFNGTKWINKTVKTSGVSKFNGYSNILPLTTDLLTKIGGSTAIIQDTVFFASAPTATKYDVKELDSAGNPIELLGFWKTPDDKSLFTDTFDNAIFYKNKYLSGLSHLFFAKSDGSDYIPMMFNATYSDMKWMYLSKTNGYDGVLAYPYNTTDNLLSTNTGVDVTNTNHYVLSWDSKDSSKTRLNIKKQLFSYNSNHKVFYSIKNYTDNSNNATIQIADNRTNFVNLAATFITYLSKYPNCDVATNLGDGKCHTNGNVFAGDFEDTLYKWYLVNGKLYDAHLVSSFAQMYSDKNSNNELYPLVLFTGELYDLVLDNNNNPCYQKQTDTKYYSANGNIIPYYITINSKSVGVIPEDKTCTTVVINGGGKIVFSDLYDLTMNYDDAPNNAIGFVTSKNKDYTKTQNSIENYWMNSTDLLRVARKGRDTLPVTNNNTYQYLSLYLGNNADPLDNSKNYRYTTNGIPYSQGNTIENNWFKKWFSANTTKSINNMVDGDCANVNYTSDACNLNYSQGGSVSKFTFNNSSNKCQISINNNSCSSIIDNNNKNIQMTFDTSENNCQVSIPEGDARFCPFGFIYSTILKKCYKPITNNDCNNPKYTYSIGTSECRSTTDFTCGICQTMVNSCTPKTSYVCNNTIPTAKYWDCVSCIVDNAYNEFIKFFTAFSGNGTAAVSIVSIDGDYTTLRWAFLSNLTTNKSFYVNLNGGARIEILPGQVAKIGNNQIYNQTTGQRYSSGGKPFIYIQDQDPFNCPAQYLKFVGAGHSESGSINTPAHYYCDYGKQQTCNSTEIETCFDIVRTIPSTCSDNLAQVSSNTYYCYKTLNQYPISLNTVHGNVFISDITIPSGTTFDSTGNEFETSLNTLTNSNLSLGTSSTIPLPNNNVVLSYNYASDTIEYQPSNGTCVSSKMPTGLQLPTPYYSHNDGNCYSELGNGCYSAGFTTQQSKVW